MEAAVSFRRLRARNQIRTVEWQGAKLTENDLLFCSTELGGEVGEALNVVKKYWRYICNWVGGVDQTASRAALAEELADVVICADRLAECAGIDLGQAIITKFNKTSVKNGLKTRF